MYCLDVSVDVCQVDVCQVFDRGCDIGCYDLNDVLDSLFDGDELVCRAGPRDACSDDIRYWWRIDGGELLDDTLALVVLIIIVFQYLLGVCV